MKLQIHLLIILLFAAAVSSPGAERRLLGCQDPAMIGRALAGLQRNNWKKVSVEDVLSIWPSRIDELKCESETGCRILISKDRVISGRCECCESFVFDIETSQDGSRTDHLANIIIRYSDREKKDVIDAAKKLARDAGLSEAQISLIGRNPVERFDWTDSRETVRQTFTMDLEFTKAGQNWELVLSVGAHPL